MSQSYRPWTERVLQPNFRLGLVWDGNAVTFHRILAVGRTRLQQFVGTGAIGTELLAAGTAGTPTQRTSFIIRDAQGNYLEDVTSAYGERIIMQIFYGFSPPWIRVFPSYPADQRDGKVLSFPAPTPGAEYGFFTGEDSPFAMPTEIGEFWFPYKTRILFDFSNPRVDRKAWPAVHCEIIKYRVQHLDPNSKTDAPIIGRMARGEAQVNWATVGPVESPKAYDLSGVWPIKPIALDAAKVVG